MGLARCAPASVFAALLVTTPLVEVRGCGGSSSPSPGPSPTPGVITVQGTERLVWNQVGDVATLRFRAYVDDRAVALDTASCNAATPDAECSSPLPLLTDGAHTIALTSVSTLSGLESERSAPITVQKVSGRAVVGATSLPDAAPGRGTLSLQATVATPGAFTFTADVLARGLKGPAQLAWAPDGRLFVAEIDGRVRVVRPGEPSPLEPMLDVRALLEPAPVGALGLALHPDFARTHFVYVSFLAHDDASRRPLLRIVRLREVGDTLGEPATIVEAPLTAAAEDAAGPRMAFGPDRLLYLALPPGVEFDREPAASTPVASLLRVQDDGRVAEGVGGVTGVEMAPLGFGWHPATGELWMLLPRAAGDVALRPLATARGSGDAGLERVRLRVREGGNREPSTLFIQEGSAEAGALAHVVLAALGRGALPPVRLHVPMALDGLFDGLSGRVGDVVAGEPGTWFLAVSEGARDTSGHAKGGDEVVVRLVARGR